MPEEPLESIETTPANYAPVIEEQNPSYEGGYREWRDAYEQKHAGFE